MSTPLDASYWDTVAGPRWVADQVRLDAVLAPYLPRLVPGLHGARRIVDVGYGCGCGATTLLCRETVPEADILALDASRPMLRRAEERARAAGDQQTRFLHADAGAHPVRPGSVDRVVSRFGVMFFADPVAAFRHMATWLTPEGRMCLVVWGPREQNPWLTAVVGALEGIVAQATPQPGPSPFSLATPAQRAAVFGPAGLQERGLERIDVPLTVRGSVEELVDFYTQRGPVHGALSEADDAGKQRILDVLHRWVSARHDRGAITLGAEALLLTLARA